MKDGQRDLLAAVCERFLDGEGLAARFFRMENTYLFIGDHKYWLMTDYNDIDPYNDEGDYVLNRAWGSTGIAGTSSFSWATAARPRTIRRLHRIESSTTAEGWRPMRSLPESCRYQVQGISATY